MQTNQRDEKRSKLQEVLTLLLPSFSLEADGEQLLQALAMDFVTDVVEGTGKMASLRNSKEISVKDICVYLKDVWDIDIENCVNK